jgi:hypothetical protein
MGVGEDVDDILLQSFSSVSGQGCRLFMRDRCGGWKPVGMDWNRRGLIFHN